MGRREDERAARNRAKRATPLVERAAMQSNVPRETREVASAPTRAIRPSAEEIRATSVSIEEKRFMHVMASVPERFVTAGIHNITRSIDTAGRALRFGATHYHAEYTEAHETQDARDNRALEHERLRMREIMPELERCAKVGPDAFRIAQETGDYTLLRAVDARARALRKPYMQAMQVLRFTTRAPDVVEVATKHGGTARTMPVLERPRIVREAPEIIGTLAEMREEEQNAMEALKTLLEKP